MFPIGTNAECQERMKALREAAKAVPEAQQEREFAEGYDSAKKLAGK